MSSCHAWLWHLNCKHMCACVYACCMHVCVCKCIYVQVCAPVCVCMGLCVYMHVAAVGWGVYLHLEKDNLGSHSLATIYLHLRLCLSLARSSPTSSLAWKWSPSFRPHSCLCLLTTCITRAYFHTGIFSVCGFRRFNSGSCNHKRNTSIDWTISLTL